MRPDEITPVAGLVSLNVEDVFLHHNKSYTLKTEDGCESYAQWGDAHKKLTNQIFTL